MNTVNKFKVFKFWEASCPPEKKHTEIQLFNVPITVSWQKNNFRATLPLHSYIKTNLFLLINNQHTVFNKNNFFSSMQWSTLFQWYLPVHSQINDAIIQDINMIVKSYLNREQYSPVYSPNIILDMITVNIGAELLTVSANETATFFKLTSPKTTVANL